MYDITIHHGNNDEHCCGHGRRSRQGRRRMRGRHGTHGRGRGGRAGRGDLRQVLLVLLAAQPMHGYQLINEISERTDGAWTPSPGGIYPNLSLLEDEGLITMSVEDGRKLATLTAEGRAQVEKHPEWAGILDVYRERSDDDPRGRYGVAFRELKSAVRGAGVDKQDAVADIIASAARQIRAL
ncbi:PadR family transcriptional regulator [Corynebacterium sp.]|uniref:PadR family transcriptional regulator n=1 Tax=Corynebacterium sp. TaxID=1720 RepID=UPI0026E048BE|nr:PadR family transcriptional regulator [Corynebacterium sp.]MDO5512191.1 PadR family transcriptional regulator [Corynebacterium sp.]